MITLIAAAAGVIAALTVGTMIRANEAFEEVKLARLCKRGIVPMLVAYLVLATASYIAVGINWSIPINVLAAAILVKELKKQDHIDSEIGSRASSTLLNEKVMDSLRPVPFLLLIASFVLVIPLIE